MPEELEEEVAVQQIVLHRAYRPDSSDYDIALVRLQGPRGRCARLSSHVLPACLPLWRERPQRTAPRCYITGWGDTGKGPSGGLPPPPPAGVRPVVGAPRLWEPPPRPSGPEGLRGPAAGL